jgi:hypothetical protein
MYNHKTFRVDIEWKIQDWLRDGSAANPADPERGVCVKGSS